MEAYSGLKQFEKPLAEDDAIGVGSEFAENRALVFGVVEAELMGDLAQQLKSSETRTEIAAGKKFYRTIENLDKFEAESKPPRDERTLKAMQKSLARIAEKYPDSIYGKAAALASEELVNREKSVSEQRDYVRSAAAQKK